MQDAFEDWMDARCRELGGSCGAKWFDAKVVGVTQPGRQDAIRTLAEYEELDLDPEPDNAFDPNAVAVRIYGGEQIGYLDRRVACDVSRALRKGSRIRAFVRCLRDGKDCCGVSIGLMQFSVA